MGVKDLWKLLEPAGRPVNLEQLQGLVLAIDVSVWLHQAVHGSRDRAGQPLQSAHLALLFSRICKLLHYQIKPVFVFDGGTPALKQQTIAARSRRRQLAGKKGERAEEKRRSKYMQARILQQLTGEASAALPPRSSSSQQDMFDLPPLPEDVFNKDRSPTFVGTSDASFMEDVEKVDVHSAEFASLPPELKHEILQERQELERHTYTDPGTLPHVASDFSDYQMSRLMKRSRLSRQLEDVRHSLKEMGSEIIGGQLGSFEVEANRIMSSDSAHYILVKGVDVEGSSSQDKLNVVMVGRDDVAGNETAELEMEEGRSDVIVCENDVVAEVEAEVVAEKEVKGAEDVSFNSLTAGGVCSSTTSVLDDIIHTAHEHTLPEEKEEEEEREKGPCVNVSTNEHQPTSDRKHAVVGAEPALKPTAKEDAIAAPISAKSPVSSEFLIPPPASANSPVSAKSTELPPASTVAESDSEVHPPEEVVGEMCDEGRGESGEVWEGGVLELSPREARSRLEEEVAELGREMERQRRAAAGIGSLVYREAQELLSLFGLPYVISPMEAEAQCAYLDHTHQTHGSVTDDSDVFLFGGQRVYRHFFSQDHQPSLFASEDIQSVLGLTRQRMVCLAYLLGSDYTPGLDGVGVVNAMEVIGQFRGEGLDSLEKLKEWHSLVQAVPGLTLTSTLEKKLRTLELPDDFPSKVVWQAYMSPEVDTSNEQFHWGTPDLDLIRKFMSGHVGWNQDRVDSVLLPVLKRTSDRERRITSHFTPSLPNALSPTITSKRLRNVVARITDRDKSPDLPAPPNPKKSKIINSSSGSDDEWQCVVDSRGKRGRGRGRGKREIPEHSTSSAHNISASSSSSSDGE